MPIIYKMVSIKRFNVDITQEKFNMIKDMVRQTGCRTFREFTDNAFTLFQWMYKKKKEGYSIVARKGDRYIELEIPCFQCFKD